MAEVLAKKKFNADFLAQVFEVLSETIGIISDDKVITEIILAWRKNQQTKGNKEIRRSFARRLSLLGSKLDKTQRNEFERMAKEIDVYYYKIKPNDN